LGLGVWGLGFGGGVWAFGFEVWGLGVWVLVFVSASLDLSSRIRKDLGQTFRGDAAMSHTVRSRPNNETIEFRNSISEQESISTAFSCFGPNPSIFEVKPISRLE